MERAGETHHGKEAQTVKINVVNVSLCNAHAEKPLTMTVSRPRIEVARAPEGAVAVLHPFAFETPFCLGHDMTPRFGCGRYSVSRCMLNQLKATRVDEKALA